MAFSFLCIRSSSTDDSNGCPTLGVAYHEQSMTERITYGNETVFIIGMVGIAEGYGKRIVENRNRFVKRDPVLFLVICRFITIPFKAHVRL